jgi:hypothetical protein
VVDGADDQDHDDVPNTRELSRRLAAGELNDGTPWTAGDAAKPQFIRPIEAKKDARVASTPLRAWVQPFNPCLPNPDSRTCPRYIPPTPYEPFDGESPDFKVLN